MRRLVQFMHPGSEPKITLPGRKPWNEQEHARSFLRARGLFSHTSTAQERRAAELVFWGEWEGPADARRLPSSGPDYPSWLCVPKVGVCSSVKRPQNTDPFVFGPTFFYSCCKQVKRDGTATYLRDLQRGDVLLFGSKLHGQFVLDTVLVIAGSELFRTSLGPQMLADKVPAEFIEVALRPLARSQALEPRSSESCAPGCGPEDWNDDDENHASCAVADGGAGTEYRLYRGATPDEPVDGMFSFAPAKVAEQPDTVFARPVVSGEFINPRLSMGMRQYPGAVRRSSDAVKAAWSEVVRQVLMQELVLGFNFALPAWEHGRRE